LAKTPVARLARKGAASDLPAAGSHISDATRIWVKRSRYNPLRQLTPQYLSNVIDQWRNGYLRDFSLMADAMRRRDTQINVALHKREKGVARHGFQVLIRQGLTEDQKAQAEKHQRALQYFYDNLTVSDVMEQDIRGKFRLLVEQMMQAIGDRYAVHEIVWQPSIDSITGEPRLTAEFNYVPVWFFEATTGKLRFIQHYFGTIMGEEMAPDEWLITVGDGLMESLSVCYLFKYTAMDSWAAFGERFGTPGIHGKTSAPKGSDQWNNFVQALQDFGQEWATVTNLDSVIELIEAKGSAGTLPFPELRETMDKAIATVVRGGDLSTMSSGKGSMGRGASLQGDETELLEQDDAQLISETLERVSEIVIRQLFGDELPLAVIKIMVPEKKNNDDTIAKLGFLVNSGVPVGVDYARKELGVPPPLDGEETLQQNQQVAQIIAADKPSPQVALANALIHQVDAGAAVFQRNAARKLTKAQAEAIQPVLDRIAALKELPAEDFAAGIQKLRNDLPRLFAEARLHSPDIAAVWEQVLGTALVDGLADKP
jgi:phage gp29-like protein